MRHPEQGTNHLEIEGLVGVTRPDTHGECHYKKKEVMSRSVRQVAVVVHWTAYVPMRVSGPASAHRPLPLGPQEGRTRELDTYRYRICPPSHSATTFRIIRSCTLSRYKNTCGAGAPNQRSRLVGITPRVCTGVGAGAPGNRPLVNRKRHMTCPKRNNDTLFVHNSVWPCTR